MTARERANEVVNRWLGTQDTSVVMALRVHIESALTSHTADLEARVEMLEGLLGEACDLLKRAHGISYNRAFLLSAIATALSHKTEPNNA